MPEEFDIKKDLEEFRYGRNILEALLFASTSKDSFKLPTNKECILREVITGTLDYACGPTSLSLIRRWTDSFEKDMFRYFKAKINSSKRRLNPNIKKAIYKMVECHTIRQQSPLDLYTDTLLYHYFKYDGGDTICKVMRGSTFSLDQETIIGVENEILPSLSKSERRDVTGIGKSMRKYIDKDLEIIAITDSWKIQKTK